MIAEVEVRQTRAVPSDAAFRSAHQTAPGRAASMKRLRDPFTHAAEEAKQNSLVSAGACVAASSESSVSTRMHAACRDCCSLP